MNQINCLLQELNKENNIKNLKWIQYAQTIRDLAEDFIKDKIDPALVKKSILKQIQFNLKQMDYIIKTKIHQNPLKYAKQYYEMLSNILENFEKTFEDQEWVNNLNEILEWLKEIFKMVIDNNIDDNLVKIYVKKAVKNYQS